VASRLYSNTRQLYCQVTACFAALSLAALGSPTLVALIGLYMTGLILLDVRQTQTRVTHFLPARCHDALNRLLRLMPLSTRATMGLQINWVKRLGLKGYLCLDDVIVEKAFAYKLPWAGWTYFLCQEAEGVWVAHRRLVVVQHRRLLAYPGRLSGAPTQAEQCGQSLSDQAATG